MGQSPFKHITYSNIYIYIYIWVFPKIGVGPQNGWFISWQTLLKWMIWGGKNSIFGSTPRYIYSIIFHESILAIRKMSQALLSLQINCDQVGEWFYNHSINARMKARMLDDFTIYPLDAEPFKVDATDIVTVGKSYPTRKVSAGDAVARTVLTMAVWWKMSVW